MDSITHIALGACMGEAFAGKTLGKKAMIWGALAQSAPDIDFLASFWMDIPSGLLAHRGFTHSFLFCLLLTPLFALTAERWHRPHDIRLGKWMLFFGGVILIHILIDAFNNYGVGWFEPFSHDRISFNAIYVADPFFSIAPVIAFGALLVLKRWSPARRRWWRTGLLISALYLGYCLFNKAIVDADLRHELTARHIPHERYFSTPAPLQNWLWYVVSGNDSGYYVGYHSVFDRRNEIDFHFFPRNDSLLNKVNDHEELQRLIRFSQQYYTVEKRNDTLVFNDLRFGQVIGWYNPREEFVFHYYLDHEAGNKLVVQRGRFAKWDSRVITSLFRRIGGR